MAVQTKLQVRRDTAANWTSTNPTLAAGEIGFETDTLKFKIGNGSTLWNALAYQNASTSAQNYAQTVGTKTLVTTGATFPYTVVSVTITTSGGPVLIMVSGDAENATAGGWGRAQLYRGSTAIGNDIQFEGSAGSENSPYAMQYIDAQAAGTYTYNFKVVTLSGSNFNFGENTGPVITAIELNSLAGTANLASNIAGGAAGRLPYQNAANTTTFLTAPSTNNSALIYNTGTSAPTWQTPPQAMASLMGYTSTATAAGFTSLDSTSSYYQQFTGSTTQTVVLPNTATLALGWTYHIVNNSTANVTANTFANAATLLTIPANTTAMVTCINTASNTATGWEFGLTDFSTYTGTGSVVMGTAPTITPANAVATTAASQAGYIGMPQNSQSVAYTLVAGDAGKHIYYTSSNTVTIPANSSVSFEVGTTITFITAPSVTLSIAITTDTLRLANSSTTGTRTLAANSIATVVKTTGTTWIISGNGLT